RLQRGRSALHRIPEHASSSSSFQTDRRWPSTVIGFHVAEPVKNPSPAGHTRAPEGCSCATDGATSCALELPCSSPAEFGLTLLGERRDPLLVVAAVAKFLVGVPLDLKPGAEARVIRCSQHALDGLQPERRHVGYRCDAVVK